ncbi:FG-GAP-like repeat-containing protein [Lentzea albidocapillata]|uniref:Repeat domain-containing protein n=1 Tax=Lentzea albidocapillata TaxID=40571 RepID=A0A1W2FNE2_9PSEU|nr:FG-GAP-like repeat-containing protein [Lentzea albidocapillata]SMD23156.1 Repeat domain-containing protein [Lentzea albidocapillata]
MNRLSGILAAITVSSLSFGLLGTGAAHAANALPCTSAGPSSADAADAAALNPLLAKKMRGHMTAYNTSCARAVVQRVKARGFNERAAAIAISTTIIESSNANLDGGDLDSVGLFQQRASWGSFAERTNPAIATDKFLDTMVRFYPNGSWNNADIGAVAADVQRPREDLRYKYGVEAPDAVKIANHLWGGGGGGTPFGKADVVRFNADGTLTGWQNNDALNGSWYAPQGIGGTGPVEPARLKFGDLNGDGREDLIRVNADGTLTGWQNNNALAGSWFAPSTIGGVGSVAPKQLRLADLNGDHKADLIKIDADGTLSAWQNNDALGGSWHAPQTIGGTGPVDPAQLRFADLNADGKADLIRVNADGTLTAWQNSNALAGSWFAPSTIGGVGADGVAGVRFADLNADGKADVIKVHGDGTLTAWRNNNALAGSWFAPSAIGGVGINETDRVEFAELG